MPSPHSQTHHDGTPVGGTAAAAPAATSAISMTMPDFWSMQQYNNEWSAQQAQIDRDWQERMSSTAHQREVADLQAAGLNPVLSAGGSGASTPSGAMAATDNSASSAYASVINSLIGAQSAQAVANKYTAMEQFVAQLNDATKKNYPSSLWGIVSSLVNGASRGRGLVGSGRDMIDNFLDFFISRKSKDFSALNSYFGTTQLQSVINSLENARHRSGRF